MRFRTEGTSSGDFFIKEARVSDNDRKNLQTEYYNAKRAAELYHPIHGNIAPPPVKYTGKTIQFHNLLGYETLIPALFLTDHSIRHSSAELVEKMGTILAMVHDCDSENQSRTEFPSSFPIPIDKYLQLNPAVLSLLKNLSSQTHHSINGLRGRISSPSVSKCHIHGDFKPDNILLHGSKIQIVDWELSGQGAPEHDFASFYAGIFTELVHRAIYQSNLDQGITARRQLENATNSSILCTKWLVSSYYKSGRPILDMSLVAQLVGAKLLARAAMHSYINSGSSPFTKILQQAAEHCLNNPSPLSCLLSQTTHGKSTDALL